MYLLFFLICQSELFNKIGRTNLGAAASCLSCCRRRHHRFLLLDINYEHLVIAIFYVDGACMILFVAPDLRARESVSPRGGYISSKRGQTPKPLN